jgi:hypothetical protein
MHFRILRLSRHCLDNWLRRILCAPRDFLRSHAATAVKSDERDRLEKLVRYMVPEHTGASRATLDHKILQLGGGREFSATYLRPPPKKWTNAHPGSIFHNTGGILEYVSKDIQHTIITKFFSTGAPGAAAKAHYCDNVFLKTML